jgi:tellurite resistance protein TehA-like permease
MSMTIASILFGIFVSTLYGAAFHYWKGGGAIMLVIYLIVSWAGFWAGQYLGASLNLDFWQVGALHLGPATLGSIAFLFATLGLSKVYLIYKDR